MSKLVRSCPVALLCLLLLLTPAAGLALNQSGDDDPRIVAGRAMREAFFDSRMAEIFDRFSEPMRAQIPDVATLEGFLVQVNAQLGDETEVISETMAEDEAMDVYVRKSRFAKTGDMIINTVFATDAEGTIQGFFIRPDQG